MDIFTRMSFNYNGHIRRGEARGSVGGERGEQGGGRGGDGANRRVDGRMAGRNGAM